MSKICKNCKNEINSDAKYCPICKKKQGGLPKWAIVLIVIFAIIVLAMAFGDDPDDTNSTDNNVTNATEKTDNTTEKTEIPELSEDEYKNSCESISYDELARNPNMYKNKKVYFRGKVVQATNNSSIFSNNSLTLRVDVTEGEYGIWDDTIYVDYEYKDENESKILEDDIITLYGEFIGEKSYTSVLGAKITLPHINAKYIVLN